MNGGKGGAVCATVAESQVLREREIHVLVPRKSVSQCAHRSPRRSIRIPMDRITSVDATTPSTTITTRASDGNRYPDSVSSSIRL